MKILVTGGKGVVGSSLVRELRAQGEQVWACDLFHSHENNYYRCDVSKFRQLQILFEQEEFDLVYHLAAEFGRWNGEDYYEQMWTSNAVGTKNLLRLQEQFGFRMIFSSSSEVYGDYDGIMAEEVMNEVAIKQMNDYAISKWANEMQILNSALMAGTQTVRVRLFNTYGPGEFYAPYRSALCVFIYRALHSLPYTVYRQHQRTSLYIDDCIRALASIPDNFKAGEVYNIAGIELHDMKSVSDMILNCLGQDDSLVIYKDEENFTTRVKKPDISKAVKDLDYQPKTLLEEGIPATIQWMRETYRLGK